MLLPVALTPRPSGKVEMLHSHTTLCAAAVFATNAVAWLNDVNAGQVISSLTIVVMGAVPLYLWGRGRIVESRNKEQAEADRIARDRRLDEIEAETKVQARRVRAALELREVQEQADKDSLTAQIARLQRSMDEASGRVEDANLKLHDQAGLHQVESLRYSEDMAALRSQLADAHRELHELREENREFRAENKLLLARIDSLSRRADDNSLRIDDLEAATPRAETP